VKRTDIEQFLPLTPMAFEVLLAVAAGQLHGYDIMLAVEERTKGRLSPNPGTLYRLIDRLCREDLLEPVEGQSGRGEDRRFFRLTTLGARVAEAEARRLEDQVKAARARSLLKRTGA
jgi:DNA-binding PadR family transcriptional regulator